MKKLSPTGMGNLVFKDVDYRADENEWIVTWSRVEGDIRFLEDTTWAVLRGDGSFENIKRDMFSKAPNRKSDRPFGAESAIEKAKKEAIQFWEKSSKKNWDEEGISLNVNSTGVYAVRPNREEWLRRNDWPLPSADGPTRLAYVVDMETVIPMRVKRAFTFEMDVWIDYETGEIVGSRYAGWIMLR